MEINRNKQVKKKEFTELNHSIFYTSLGTNKQMVVIFRACLKMTEIFFLKKFPYQPDYFFL